MQSVSTICMQQIVSTICMQCQILFTKKNKKKYLQFVVFWICPECGKG